MTDESANHGGPGLPPAVDRAAFQAELDRLRAREKAHTREGDAIAAARRRLPMVEVDASLTLTGPHGPVTLLDAFEGRRQLIAYYFMWWAGHPAAEQCEGCTWVTAQVTELSYLHSRSGSRREFHPPAPTEPCVIVSHYTALATLITRNCGTIASERTSSGIAA